MGVSDKDTGGVPDTGQSPYDDPTVAMQRDDPTLKMQRPGSYTGAEEASSSHVGDRNQFGDQSHVSPGGPSHGVEPGTRGAAPAKVRRGTTDLGLLVLRLVVGATLIVHGLQKLVGLWGGPGLDGFESTLRDAGYQQPQILAIVGAVGELAAGGFLVLGLLTPIAAAAIVAIMINAVLFKHELEPGFQYFASDASGIEYEVLLVGCAVALTLTGPGRIAVDGPRGWSTRPFIGSLVALLLGVAAGVCLWIFGR